MATQTSGGPRPKSIRGSQGEGVEPWLFRVGDEQLPSYLGFIINHYKHPGLKQPVYIMESYLKAGFFFRGSIDNLSLYEFPLSASKH